ncbi:competence protein CoiA family protein [Staphylococcus aureus]
MFCPYCKTEVILRKGVKVVPHFAHKYNIHRLYEVRRCL